MLMWVFSVVHTGDVLSIAQETMGTYLGVLRFSYTTLFFISNGSQLLSGWKKKQVNFINVLNNCRKF